MKKEIEIQRIRKRYLKEIVCQSRKWLVMAGIAMLILSIIYCDFMAAADDH